MKKSSLKIWISIIFFLVYHADNAQSFTTASENVTIKIIKKISVSINNSVENNYNHRYRHINKAYSRNLLISYLKNSKANQYVNANISTNSISTTLTVGEEKELRNLYSYDYLHVVVRKMNNIKMEHIFTIVY